MLYLQDSKCIYQHICTAANHLSHPKQADYTAAYALRSKFIMHISYISSYMYSTSTTRGKACDFGRGTLTYVKPTKLHCRHRTLLRTAGTGLVKSEWNTATHYFRPYIAYSRLLWKCSVSRVEYLLCNPELYFIWYSGGNIFRSKVHCAYIILYII
jgi:hypothetical protein